MNKGLLDPRLAEVDEKKKYQQMDGSYDEERYRHARIVGKPEGKGE